MLDSIRRKSLVIFKSSFSRTGLGGGRRATSRDSGDRLLLTRGERRGSKGEKRIGWKCGVVEGQQ